MKRNFVCQIAHFPIIAMTTADPDFFVCLFAGWLAAARSGFLELQTGSSFDDPWLIDAVLFFFFFSSHKLGPHLPSYVYCPCFFFSLLFIFLFTNMMLASKKSPNRSN